MSIEAMKQALEALEISSPVDYDDQRAANHDAAITALRTAIEQAEKQEPVAWMHPSGEGYDSAFRDHSTVMACTGNKWDGWIPLYTTPPAAQRQWVGLSEEEIDKLKHLIDWTATWSHGRFAYEIEQLLKEKNA